MENQPRSQGRSQRVGNCLKVYFEWYVFVMCAVWSIHLFCLFCWRKLRSRHRNSVGISGCSRGGNGCWLLRRGLFWFWLLRLIKGNRRRNFVLLFRLLVIVLITDAGRGGFVVIYWQSQVFLALLVIFLVRGIFTGGRVTMTMLRSWFGTHFVMVFLLILGVGFARTSASGIWGNQERFLSWILLLVQEVIGYRVIVRYQRFDLSFIVCNTVYESTIIKKTISTYKPALSW